MCLRFSARFFLLLDQKRCAGFPVESGGEQSVVILLSKDKKQAAISRQGRYAAANPGKISQETLADIIGTTRPRCSIIIPASIFAPAPQAISHRAGSIC